MTTEHRRKSRSPAVFWLGIFPLSVLLLFGVVAIIVLKFGPMSRTYVHCVVCGDESTEVTRCGILVRREPSPLPGNAWAKSILMDHHHHDWAVFPELLRTDWFGPMLISCGVTKFVCGVDRARGRLGEERAAEVLREWAQVVDQQPRNPGDVFTAWHLENEFRAKLQQ